MVAQGFTVDLDKALVFQVGHLGEAYQEWVHQPIVSKEGPRFFESEFWEFLTRTQWWLIPLIWLPVVCYFISKTIAMGHTFTQVFFLIVTGISIWTLMEYTLHRFLFHIKTKSYWGNTMHYLLHGCHHKHPMDGLRLVFPPAATAVLCFPFYNLIKLFATPSITPALFGGGLLGYVMYDVTHYYLHHGQPTTEMPKNLKKYHLNHHFRIQTKGFGITSSFWDKVFGTLPTSKSAEKAWKSCNANQDDFLECMNNNAKNSNQDSNLIHTQNSSSYINLLQSAEQNPRWINSISTRPLVIITPSNYSDIQAAVLCSKNHGMEIRVKSGGHDYEGLSFHSDNPFVMIDLVNLRTISINLGDQTAWVEAGATLGELYYAIASRTTTYGFPAGICPSVGVGGHFSGGGIGTMTRKYGLASDNVVDATIIDVEGRILDRKAMGEDLFWAIRGGGGANFGVILAWKIKLVPVPQIVSFFRIQRDMDTKGIELVDIWQKVASKLPNELLIRVVIQKGNGQTGVVALYESLFLGRKNELIGLISKSFPQLGLNDEDIIEMSWIESEIDFAFQKQQPLDVLLNRIVTYKGSFKGKSDFVEKPIPFTAFKGMCDRVLIEEQDYIILEPSGGIMDEISDSATPYPHRKGCLYNIQYVVKWGENDDNIKHLEWMNELYDFMKPYVSNSPRRAYINYRDLDIGMNQKEGNTSYLQAKIWGEKYFRNNFNKLAQVKSRVDPGNFFRNEQSVPLV